MMTSGGVCAVLDYELDQMIEYVAETAQKVVLPNAPVSGAFRKFVSGLLSSTRLPKTTILLGMNYLARRTNTLNAEGAYKPTEGSTWRMLTIGLLLGSKFLDDNTFQNRSWSEVSGISVAELNKMETEWLVDMGWHLYVNLDESSDYNAWIAHHENWVDAKNKVNAATLERLAPLAPINTNVSSHPASKYSKILGFDKEGERTNALNAARAKAAARAAAERPRSVYYGGYDAWSNPYPTPQLTPPSAPDSGLNTPDNLSATGGAPRWNDWSVFQQYSGGYGGQQHTASYIPSHHSAGYHAPYTPQYGMHHNIWDASVADCGCSMCNGYPKQQSYNMMPHGFYGQQIMAG